MVPAKHHHRESRYDKGSGEPTCRPVGTQSRRLLLDVGKSRQSAGRVYELRAYRQAGRRGHVLLHGEHRRSGVDSEEEVSAKQIIGTRVRFIPETTRGSSNQVTTRSLVSENTFWEELKLDSSASSSGGDDDEDVTENPLG